MRKLGLALAVGVLAAGTAAHAQTSGGSIANITSSAGTTVTASFIDPYTVLQSGGVTSGTSANRAGDLPTRSGSSFNSFVNVGGGEITFESANTFRSGTTQPDSSSPNLKTTSFSSVSFDVINGGGAKFSSTITAAGLGFYLADTSGGCSYMNCPQVAVGSGYNFSQLPFGGPTVGFDFSVTSNTSATPLYSLSGSMSMFTGGGTSLDRQLGTLGNGDVGPSGPRTLTNFRESVGDDFTGTLSQIGLATGIGYAWDATPISFFLPNPDASFQTLTYTTSVYTDVGTSCIRDSAGVATSICLVAYSGFGDPVGTAGAVTDFSDLLGSISSFSQPINGGLIGGVNFAPTTFDAPTFGPNGVSFQEAGVPEPATWTMMIAGFGLLGAALRRRRVLAYN
jgi:hypothetical protein